MTYTVITKTIANQHQSTIMNNKHTSRFWLALEVRRVIELLTDDDWRGSLDSPFVFSNGPSNVLLVSSFQASERMKGITKQDDKPAVIHGDMVLTPISPAP